MNNLLLLLMLLGCKSEYDDTISGCDCKSPTMKPADCGCKKECSYNTVNHYNDCENVYERNYDFDCNCSKKEECYTAEHSDCSCQHDTECHCKNCQHSCNCNYEKEESGCNCNDMKNHNNVSCSMQNNMNYGCNCNRS